MSILSKNSGSNMGTPLFHQFKKQASFFLKEKIKTARLALTDVTPAELLTEEAINGNPRSPDTRTLGSISRAAFELDDYWRIVEILHKRLLRFDRKNWRPSYNSLIVLEHLLTHGPESGAEEFQSDRDVIGEMGSFQYIDDGGFNWGLAVRKKSERTLKLLEKGALLKEERARARKLTRGIQGFGSFCQRSSSAQGILQVSSGEDHKNQDEQFLSSGEGDLEDKVGRSQQSQDIVMDNSSFKENMDPDKEEVHTWNLCKRENGPLLEGKKDEGGIESAVEGDNHPFNDTHNYTTASLLSARDGILQGC